MASLEEELEELKERNNELVRKVQFWKMEAAQRDNEKVNLMKEINELRLQLSRVRSNGNVQASNFETALQSTSEKALALLVRASGEIATTMDLAKAYMRDRQELNAASLRWSSIGSTPPTDKKDKVHRVPPLMMGGQSIQPVVALTMLNTSNTRAVTRSPNQNRNVTQRAVPMHMLQDVYIPLTRIDVGDLQTQHMETEAEANEETEDSSEELALDDIEDRAIDESQHMSEDENYDNSGRLESVLEDVEPEEEEPPSSLTRSSADNPLEGPSWLLDNSADNNQGNAFTSLEPDSTTGLEENSNSTSPITVNNQLPSVPLPRTSFVFSPTVRRRKRTSAASPPPPAHYSPRPLTARRISNTGRVLKVLVAKMRLDGEEAGGSPPKRAAPALSFDSPSPNGATVAGVIVSETSDQNDSLAAAEPAPPSTNARAPREGRRSRLNRTLDRHEDRPVMTDRASNDRSVSRQARRDDSRPLSRESSHDSRDSDSSGGEPGEGRTRRPRKVVTYKEKPLNRKMRR